MATLIENPMETEDRGVNNMKNQIDKRPCDGCALRKVRCDRRKPCYQCTNHRISCTNTRVKKKCGPKRIHKKTQESIQRLCLGSGVLLDGSPKMLLTVDKLLPYLQIYQTWYYGVWPVLSTARVMADLVNGSEGFQSPLTMENAPVYALACSVCAAIGTQLDFLSDNTFKFDIPMGIAAEEFAKESIRIRTLNDYRLVPSAESLLTSFFLYDYYGNTKGGKMAAIMYLREALSIAQILGLHDPKTYVNRSTAGVHRLKKIFYLLLVTERYMCISDNIPVILESSIPYPSLEDEEYPELLHGFTELVRIFSTPDKAFFDRLAVERSSSSSNSKKQMYQFSNPPSRTWIINVQDHLQKSSVSPSTSDTQKLNIILSQHWIRALGWHIANQNGLLLKDSNDNNCLNPQFPLQIAKDFLSSTDKLSQFAFESNGPGICVKLLEIASALADSVSGSMIHKYDTYNAYDALGSIFRLVTDFLCDIIMPNNLYNKIDSFINNKTITSFPVAYITEIDDDTSSGRSNNSDIDEKHDNTQNYVENNHEVGRNMTIPTMFEANNPTLSPFTQMTMGFGCSPINILHSLSPSILLIQPICQNQHENHSLNQGHSSHLYQDSNQQPEQYHPYTEVTQNQHIPGSNIYAKKQRSTNTDELDLNDIYGS